MCRSADGIVRGLSLPPRLLEVSDSLRQPKGFEYIYMNWSGETLKLTLEGDRDRLIDEG
jgi:hypothetical protein